MGKQQGKKFNDTFRQEVLGVYLGCLNYNLTARVFNIAPNSVKNIVRQERKKDPRNFAKLCTKNYKRGNEKLVYNLEKTQEAVFDLAGFKYMDNPFMLNQFMNTQDRQLISRQKLLYDAKIKAICYEATRIERALFLRDLDALVKLLKEAKKDTKLYEPLDFAFLGKTGHYGFTDDEQRLSAKDRKLYIEAIERYLEDNGHNLKDFNIEDYIASTKDVTNYYYY